MNSFLFAKIYVCLFSVSLCCLKTSVLFLDVKFILGTCVQHISGKQLKRSFRLDKRNEKLNKTFEISLEGYHPTVLRNARHIFFPRFVNIFSHLAIQDRPNQDPFLFVEKTVSNWKKRRARRCSQLLRQCRLNLNTSYRHVVDYQMETDKINQRTAKGFSLQVIISTVNFSLCKMFLLC